MVACLDRPIMFTELEYTIPVKFLPVIFYSDFTGLDDTDVQVWEIFEKRVPVGHWSYPEDIDGEKYFTYYNDVERGLGEDCVDLIYMASNYVER